MLSRRRLLLSTTALLLFAATPGVRADDKADALMKEVETATKAATTLTADLDMSLTIQGKTGKPNEQKMHGTVKLKKPNMARIELSAPGGNTTTASDGKTVYMLSGNEYRKMTADPQGRNINAQFALQIPIFFGTGLSMLGKDITYRYVEPKSIDGADYQVVEVTTKSSPGQTITFSINPDKLVTRLDAIIKQGDQTINLSAAMKNVKLNADLADADFAYKLPPNAKEMQEPDYDAKLVPVGKHAPAFDLLKPAGGKVSLASALNGKKAVLVNFWFYGWGACREEFPHLQALYKELKDKGLELVAINDTDSPLVINKYVKENKFSFLIGLGGGNSGDPKVDVARQYGVQAYPTNYVLDDKGNVVFRTTGFDADGIRAALAKLGVK